MALQNLFAFSLQPQLIRSILNPRRLGLSFPQSQRNASRKRSYELEHLAGVIGTREMVGFGINGQPYYADLTAFPFPAIRYMEDTPEIMALREKEKGDWRLLSREEKRKLYRTQYCQTFVEFKHVSTEWMAVVGYALIFISAGIWLFIGMHEFVYEPLPISFYKDHKMAQLKRMIELRVNPITGLASMWDYEKNEWKNEGYLPNPYIEEECEDE